MEGEARGRQSFCCRGALLLPVRGHCRLIDPYGLKYKAAELSTGQLKRIGRYDRLIVSSRAIASFRPGYRVHPDCIRVLMPAESGGNANAVSPGNAIGLCHIISPTARAGRGTWWPRGAGAKRGTVLRFFGQGIFGLGPVVVLT